MAAAGLWRQGDVDRSERLTTERAARLRLAVARLMDAGWFETSNGAQVRLAEQFGVSRQRVGQLVAAERRRRL